MPVISPKALWLAHHAAADGRSKVSGAALPETLDACVAGVQETHYGMCVFIAVAHGEPAEDVPVPPAVDPVRAVELCGRMAKFGRSVAGLAGAFGPLEDALRSPSS